MGGDKPDSQRRPLPWQRSATPAGSSKNVVSQPSSAVQTIWQLIVATVTIALRYRVTSLAAEVAFFALLALPPLVLALAASAAWLSTLVTSQLALERAVRDFLIPFLTEDVVRKVIIPTLRDALNTPRYDVISIGFVFSLWSGSRALHVYVDTISIMYGLAGGRGVVRSRLLSFAMYVGALLLGAVLFPLILVGPGLIRELTHDHLPWLMNLYWPVVAVLGVLTMAWLFHLATPVRTAWWRNLAGALLGMVFWVLASSLMRLFLTVSLSPAPTSTRALSIYGPLTTPIVLLLWLYLLALGVLVGAALNAAIDRRFPDGERSAKRAELADRIARETAMGFMLTPVRDTEAEAAATRSSGAAAAFDIGHSDVRNKPRPAAPGDPPTRPTG